MKRFGLPTIGLPTISVGVSHPCEGPQKCKHHHEAVKLKEVLHQSLKDGNQMMIESTNIINNLKEEYEKTQSLLVQENDSLRKELIEIKEKLNTAVNSNIQEISQLAEKINKAEKLVEDSEKKEPQKPDVFTRLSRPTSKKKSNG